jgi:hypothetical protein
MKSFTQYLLENNNSIIAYHGSDGEFDKFDPKKMGTRTDPGFFGRGAYFVSDKDNAQRWGKHVITAKIKLNNPLTVSSITEFIAKTGQQPTGGDKIKYAAEINRITDELITNGFDGVIFNRSNGTTQYVCFFPNSQIQIIKE